MPIDHLGGRDLDLHEIEVSSDRFAPVADTVAHALETPDLEQPYAALGLKDDEYTRIREILGRRPTGAELAMYSVMWSEHCSYKSSKVHLKKFGELSQDTPRGPLLVGIGENVGVVDIGQGYAVTFKAESHNHPSFVEPYSRVQYYAVIRAVCFDVGSQNIATSCAIGHVKLQHPHLSKQV